MPESFVFTQLDRWDIGSLASSGWPELFAALPDPRFYQHPDWLLAAGEHLLDRPLSLALVSRGADLVALIPWQSRVQRRRLHAPAHDHLSLGDILVHPELASAHQAPALIHTLDRALSMAGQTLWDWQIGNVPNRSALSRIVPDQQSATGLWQRRQTRQSAWFDLTEGPPPQNGKLRRNLRRLRSRLHEAGRVSMQWVDRQEDLPAALDHFLGLEASGWKGAPGQATAIAGHPDLTRFYRQLARPRFDGLQPVITLSWLDDQCVAAQFGLLTGSCLSILKIAYSEAYSDCSPGSLLLQDTAEIAISRGLSTLSLVTAPAWAARWHPHTEPVWHVTRYTNTAGGLTLHTLDRLKQAVRNRRRHAA
jgi:CelD/BcsL family acetyltransferase involved in cellulose biosynthesis